jgi:hypothetical protein
MQFLQVAAVVVLTLVVAQVDLRGVGRCHIQLAQ